MKTRNNKSGFTLLEIIIVIIIIGVLASLALPRFFTLVEFVKGGEAQTANAAARGGAVRYKLSNGDSYTGINPDMSNLDTGNPGGTALNPVPNAHFTYTIAVNGAGTAFTITAFRNTHQGGGGIANTVWLSQDDAAGTVTKGGTSAFAGI